MADAGDIAVHLDNLMLDVLLDPFLFGKGLVANCIVSIDVCSLIHPQAGKLGYRRETGHGRTGLHIRSIIQDLAASVAGLP